MSVRTTIFDGKYNARFRDIPTDGSAGGAEGLDEFFTYAGENADIIVPPGIYQIDTLSPAVLPGQKIDFSRATLKHAANTTLTSLLDLDDVDGVEITGGIFDGNVANQAVWSEQRHCIRIRDGSNCTVRNARFQNIIGDGIYISHAPSPAVAPFIGSLNTKILNCDFIGANLNRNGISIICATATLIQGNYFYRMTQAGYPGSIDIEPNSGDEFVYDLKILDNTVDNLGSLVMPNGGIAGGNHVTTAIIDGVVIARNDIKGQMIWGIRLRMNGATTEKGCAVESNYVHDLSVDSGDGYGIRVDDATCRLINNEVDGVAGSGIAQTSSDVFASGNIVRNVTPGDTAAGYGMVILDTDDVATWQNNAVYDSVYGFYLRSDNNFYTGNRAVDCTNGYHVASGTGNKIINPLVTGATTPYGGIAGQFVSINPAVGANVGNAAKTLTVLVDEPIQRWESALGSDRAVTLSTVNAFNGATFRIIRTATATGAFNLNVGTGPLKALAVGTWCEVTYNGSAWMLTAYGAL